MSTTLIAKGAEGSRFPKLEAGLYNAVCYAVIDLGIQYNKNYDKESQQIMILFELPDEQIEINGRMEPRTVSGTYTNSLSDKSNLRKILEGWRGRAFTAEELKGFDLEKLLGLPCMVNMIDDTGANGNVYSKIGSVSRLPKGHAPVEGSQEPFIFELIDETSLIHMQSLPEWIQNRIKESRTYKEIKESEGTGGFGEISSEDLLF